MLLKSLLAVGAIVTSAVASPVRRDLPTFNNVFARITSDVNRLNQDLNFWLGDAQGVNIILTGSQNLINDLDVATKIIGGTAAIGNVDFLRILGEINTLNTAVGAYTKTLNLKKPLFDATPNLTGQILWYLRQQRQGADVLSKAINSKMPAIPAAMGPWIADQITQKLDAAMKIYSSLNTFPTQNGGNWNPPKPNQNGGNWNPPKPNQNQPYQNQPFQGQPYQGQPSWT